VAVFGVAAARRGNSHVAFEAVVLGYKPVTVLVDKDAP
jgi:hypothetical protein